MESKLIGASLQHFVQESSLQDCGKFFPGARQVPLAVTKQVDPPILIDSIDGYVGHRSLELEVLEDWSDLGS